jgi:hypothetical protein
VISYYNLFDILVAINFCFSLITVASFYNTFCMKSLRKIKKEKIFCSIRHQINDDVIQSLLLILKFNEHDSISKDT